MPRPKGSKNVSKILRVKDVLANLGVNPIEELLKIVHDLSPKEAARVWLELQSFCEAKPRELLSDGDDDGEDLSSVPQEKLLTMIRNG